MSHLPLPSEDRYKSWSQTRSLPQSTRMASPSSTSLPATPGKEALRILRLEAKFEELFGKSPTRPRTPIDEEVCPALPRTPGTSIPGIEPLAKPPPVKPTSLPVSIPFEKFLRPNQRFRVKVKDGGRINLKLPKV